MTGSTHDEVMARFHAYERALTANDLASLHEFFTPDAHRFGPNATQHGADEISKSRQARTEPLKRRLDRVALRVLGDDVVVATAEFEEPNEVGRQTQIWVKQLGTWRITHAHVSVIPMGEQQ